MTAATGVLASFKAAWATMAEMAVWVTTLVLVFVAQPPRLAPVVGIDPSVGLVQFSTAILVGLLIIVFRRAKSPKHDNAFLYGSAALAILGMGLFFCYSTLVGMWTCEYDDRGPVMTGAHLLPSAAAYLQQHPLMSCKQLIQNSAGQLETIWPKSELVLRHTLLAVLFVATVTAMATAAMLVVESKRRSSLREKKSP